MTREEKWAYILNNLDALREIPRGFDEEIFMQFLDTAELARLGPDERFAYEESLKVYRDNKNVMDYAIEEAHARGREEGLVEGETRGIEKGIEQGRAEHEARGGSMALRQVALNMKRKGVSLEEISEFTGISPEVLETLS